MVIKRLVESCAWQPACRWLNRTSVRRPSSCTSVAALSSLKRDGYPREYDLWLFLPALKFWLYEPRWRGRAMVSA